MSAVKEKLRDVAEGLRYLKRAMQGLPLDEDQTFSGLLNIKDIRERTRLNKHEIYAHSYMRLLAHYGGEEWGIMDRRATEEDTYNISEGGEQRKEAILMTKARSEISVAGQPLAITMPSVETKPQPPPEQKQEKKGILRR